MTKAELIDRIARSRDLPPEVTKKVIAKLLDITFAELSGYFVRARVTRSGNPRFTFPKFGTFTKKQRSSRRGVNPRTLEPIEIEACETVDFKPSIELKRQLNEAANAKPSKTKAARKKKAARSSSKRKPVRSPIGGGETQVVDPIGCSKGRQNGSRSSAGVAGAKLDTVKPRSAAGPRGRKLVTREEADLELSAGEPLLPEAPLRNVGRRRSADSSGSGTSRSGSRSKGVRGSDLDGTGT